MISLEPLAYPSNSSLLSFGRKHHLSIQKKISIWYNFTDLVFSGCKNWRNRQCHGASHSLESNWRAPRIILSGKFSIFCLRDCCKRANLTLHSPQHPIHWKWKQNLHNHTRIRLIKESLWMARILRSRDSRKRKQFQPQRGIDYQGEEGVTSRSKAPISSQKECC